MLGAITGDIIGSLYEFKPVPRRNFKLFKKESHFTDDTVLTVALMDSLMNKKDWVDTIHEYYEKYKDGGFGGYFIKWCKEKSRVPYNSYGNGSAMRVSPVAWLYDTLDEVRKAARESAAVTHNHPEGIKGAEALASAIFLARTTKSKDLIRWYIQDQFYFMGFTLPEIKKATMLLPTKGPACSSAFSVPPAILCYLCATNFEETIRFAVNLGGDVDTVACMAGSIAEAHYGIPREIKYKTFGYLDGDLARTVVDYYRLVGFNLGDII